MVLIHRKKIYTINNTLIILKKQKKGPLESGLALKPKEPKSKYAILGYYF
jgi:hypothetical protein